VILAANVSSLARVRRRAKPALVLLASALAGAILMSCGGSSTPNRLVIYEGKAAVTEAGLEYSNVTDVRDATNVYAIDAKSGKTTQLTHGESFDGHPGWAPDYKHILFSSDRNDMPGQQDIYIMDADGSNPRALTSTRGVSEWTPKFSPDASQIVFVQVNKPGGSYLMLMDPDGGNQRRVAGPYVFAEFPAWRRDGTQIFFAAIAQGKNDIDIYSYDVASGEVRTEISTPSADVCPHFTRDGKSMTYATGAPDEDSNVDLYEHDLASDDTTGKSDRRLTDTPGVDDYLNPSPDGKSFVFLSDRDGNVELYLMDRDGSNQRRLTDTPDVRENVPDW
jgi:TolB protein